MTPDRHANRARVEHARSVGPLIKSEAVMRFTWETPPDHDDPTVPTRTDIARALERKRGRWAIVARHDRAARAQSMVERITDGREYGDGYEAVARRVANEHRVYARRLPSL